MAARLTEDDASTIYIEFQNRASHPPIVIRSVEYLGLGIGHSKGKIANQLWLLAEDVDSAIYAHPFAHYILKNEVTGKGHLLLPALCM